ncbi:MFS transporter [Saccharibacillus sp. CPCC 101409]|uniref:MFS transporter n=1 Tax=Saccharibacillus sp. CPCC 101409 TaxID=3058041 RepID=UPI0026712A12|nr:MFS transporter [Saccharibacillus sp. CPCC 101409]MDO3408278.1 MFS transporter [Saccharibacillus sp. CPCC 101409]
MAGRSLSSNVPEQSKEKLGANPNYKRLFAAVALTFLGDGLTLTAVPWLISGVTRDTFQASLVTTAMRLPWLLFSLPIGVLIDRHSRKQIAVLSSLLRAAALIALTACVALNAVSIPLLMVFTFLIGVSRVAFDSTVQTLIPRIVHKDRLEKANGQFTAGQLITSDILGASLGGLIVTIGLVIPFAIDSATALLSFLILLSLRGAFRPEPAPDGPAQSDSAQGAAGEALPDASGGSTRPGKRERTGWLREMSLGIRYIGGDPFLRLLAVMSVLVTLTFSGMVATQVFFVQDVLGLDSLGFGVLLAIATVGSVIGGQAVARWRKRAEANTVMLLSLLALGVCYGIVGLTRSPYVVGAFYFLAAFFIVTYNVVRSSILQRSVPDHLLGRVGSVFRFLSLGMGAIGALLGGLVVSLGEESLGLGRTASLQIPYWIVCVVDIALAAAAFARLRAAGRTRI